MVRILQEDFLSSKAKFASILQRLRLVSFGLIRFGAYFFGKLFQEHYTETFCLESQISKDKLSASQTPMFYTV